MQARACERVEVVRSGLLDGIPHGFFGRRGGVSEGEMCGAQRRLRQRRRSRRDRREPPAGGRGGPAGRAAGDRAPDPFADASSSSSTPGRRTSGRMPTRWSPTGPECCSACSPPIARRCCSPIAEAGVVGAAHAGWRGAIAGVTEATIAAMEQLGARRERIAAAVGPCIAQASYEVDEAFRERFLAEDAANERFFVDGPAGKPHFDLRGYVAARLAAAASARSKRSASTPMPTRTVSTATAARPTAASRHTGGRSA